MIKNEMQPTIENIFKAENVMSKTQVKTEDITELKPAIEEKVRTFIENPTPEDIEFAEKIVKLGVELNEGTFILGKDLVSGDVIATDEEILELRNNCTWEWTSLDGVNGFMVTGPNGNRIFLPAGGEIINDKNESLGNTCSYWGGTKSFIRNAHTISAFYDEENGRIKVMCWGDYRPFGRLVRPVMDNKPE